jgi:hypothetical protein
MLAHRLCPQFASHTTTHRLPRSKCRGRAGSDQYLFTIPAALAANGEEFARESPSRINACALALHAPKSSPAHELSILPFPHITQTTTPSKNSHTAHKFVQLCGPQPNPGQCRCPHPARLLRQARGALIPEIRQWPRPGVIPLRVVLAPDLPLVSAFGILKLFLVRNRRQGQYFRRVPLREPEDVQCFPLRAEDGIAQMPF